MNSCTCWWLQQYFKRIQMINWLSSNTGFLLLKFVIFYFLCISFFNTFLAFQLFFSFPLATDTGIFAMQKFVCIHIKRFSSRFTSFFEQPEMLNLLLTNFPPCACHSPFLVCTETQRLQYRCATYSRPQRNIYSPIKTFDSGKSVQ